MLDGQQLADGLNAFYFILLPMRSVRFLCRQGVDMQDICKKVQSCCVAMASCSFMFPWLVYASLPCFLRPGGFWEMVWILVGEWC